MKIQNILLASAAALTLVAGLTGCTGTTNDSDLEVPYEVTQEAIPSENFTVKFDPTNGHIVKVSNKTTFEVLYADPALSTMDEASLLVVNDKINPFLINRDGGQGQFESLSGPVALSFETPIEASAHIDGKSYPTQTSIRGKVLFDSNDDMVMYYNAYVADPEMIKNMPPAAGLIGRLVYDHVRTSAREAAEQSVGYTATILEIRGNDIVAADHANGVSASQAYRHMISDSTPTEGYSDSQPVPEPRDPNSAPPVPEENGDGTNPTTRMTVYAYAYMCALYDVLPADASEQTNNLLDDAIEVTEIISFTESILAETVAPCDVIKSNE